MSAALRRAGPCNADRIHESGSTGCFAIAACSASATRASPCVPHSLPRKDRAPASALPAAVSNASPSRKTNSRAGFAPSGAVLPVKARFKPRFRVPFLGPFKVPVPGLFPGKSGTVSPPEWCRISTFSIVPFFRSLRRSNSYTGTRPVLPTRRPVSRIRRSSLSCWRAEMIVLRSCFVSACRHFREGNATA